MLVSLEVDLAELQVGFDDAEFFVPLGDFAVGTAFDTAGLLVEEDAFLEATDDVFFAAVCFFLEEAEVEVLFGVAFVESCVGVDGEGAGRAVLLAVIDLASLSS